MVVRVTCFLCLATVLSSVVAPVAVAQESEPSFVSGLTPDRRPEGVPQITEVEKGGAWYQHALEGVESPYPASLRFLEDQGAWYTPFTHRGMTSPYDIRDMHDE